MPVQYARIIAELSQPRLSTYLGPLGFVQTKDSSRSHFLLNDISQHFYVPLQLIEITLRNKINGHISVKMNRANWYEHLPVSGASQAAVAEAKRLANEEVMLRSVSHDDVVCRLMFGFWAYMLDPVYRNSADAARFMWSQHDFKKVFDGAPAGISIGMVTERLKNMNSLRNRLFHHEPVWRVKSANSLETAIRALKIKYADMVEVLQWMSPELHALFVAWAFPGRFAMACDPARFDRPLW